MLRKLLLIVALTAVLSCGPREPLSSYDPKSPQEQALKRVLLDFQESVNTKNAKKLESLIHEKAAIMVGRERKIVTRAEYAKIIPERLSENPPVALSIPKMMVKGDTAEVRIYITRGDYSGLMVFFMQQEKDRWYIKSWEY